MSALNNSDNPTNNFIYRMNGSYMIRSSYPCCNGRAAITLNIYKTTYEKHCRNCSIFWNVQISLSYVGIKFQLNSIEWHRI